MKEPKNPLMVFVGGLAMLIAGLYFISTKVMVTSTFLGTIAIGGMHVNSGLILVPFIIGIVWMFMSDGSIGSKILTVVGVFLVVISIIVNTQLVLVRTNLFEWVIILILIFGGAALCTKVLFSSDGKGKR